MHICVGRIQQMRVWMGFEPKEMSAGRDFHENLCT